MIRGAKASGLVVTAEVAPHHFTLTDAEVASYDPVFKVNPPLRSAADVAAVKAALADGVVDAIATDHAPHTQETKEAALRPGPPGHARSGDGAGPGADGTGPAAGADPGPAVVAAGRHRRPGRRARRSDRRRRARQPLRHRPDAPSGWSIRPPWPAGAATRPYAGRALVGPQPPHRPAAASRWSSTGRRSDERSRRPGEWRSGERSRRPWEWRSGERSRRPGEWRSGERSRPPGAGTPPGPGAAGAGRRDHLRGPGGGLVGPRTAGPGGRRGGVQHHPDRLSGGADRSVLRRPDRVLHLSAHRQLRDHGRRQREPAGLLPRPHRAGAGRPGRAAGGRSGAWASSWSTSGCPGSRGSTPGD